MAVKIPESIGKLLIGDEYVDIYTLEQINELMLKLPQGIRRASETKITAYKEWQSKKLATKQIKNELRVKTSKNWKETFSSSKDRDAYVDSHESVQQAEKAELDAQEVFLRAEALETQLDNNYTALKKIYQTFADDNKMQDRIERQVAA